MSEKILVADDSPTIQKVVGITLASTDFQISPAHSTEELFNFLESDSFDLILLDFNLSEEKEGYELCKEIGEKAGSAKIIVMLGTFDSVDENKLTDVGVSEKVIKPFESTKFIQKINDTLAGGSLDLGVSPLDMSESDFSHPEEDDSEFDSEPDNLLSDDDSEEDEWSMAGPSGETHSPEEDSSEELISSNTEEASGNELYNEMAGWGMEVPSIIGGEGESLMPPKMDGESPSNDHLVEETGEWNPQEIGLTPDSEKPSEEYSFEENVNSFDDSAEEESKKPSTSLVSLDELVNDENDDYDDEEDIDDTDPQIIIEQSEDDPNLEAELSGEMGTEDFWAADENYDLEAESNDNQINIAPSEEDGKIEKHTSIEAGPKIEKVAEEVGSKEALDALNELAQHEGEVGPKMEEVGPKMEAAKSFDTNDIVNQVIEQLKPQLKDLIQEVVKDMSKETIEGVAWEIIPDLAENLIRNEVENLSKKVQNKHSLS
jgi:CheY-like chemotaxis protein